ncbi:hypothetical protein DYU11_11550 [Fibrisoma montanum]|uniref:Right handed beta helix domain-containing protein n=1 Tax=Fibrisoma montanum TaxID=2305895 RepID=A0A418MB62_9BACT|nr:right-handed parallel beta-helix repeat-containing protein [Fibrisoma montanum]RIV23609.1 hypothetical protein DYU11_11550 [Fibrisoma montanum]
MKNLRLLLTLTLSLYAGLGQAQTRLTADTTRKPTTAGEYGLSMRPDGRLYGIPAGGPAFRPVVDSLNIPGWTQRLQSLAPKSWVWSRVEADNRYKPIGYTPTKAEMGLENVSNTSDENKPLSAAQRAALAEKIEPKTIAQIRSAPLFNGQSQAAYIVTDLGREGILRRDDNDFTTPDNGATVIVNSVTGYRYKRVFDGPIIPRWFGVVGNGTTDDTAPLQAALNAAVGQIARKVSIPVSLTCLVSSITIPAGVTLEIQEGAVIRGRALTSAEQTTANRDVPVIECAASARVIGPGTVDGNKTARFWSRQVTQNNIVVTITTFSPLIYALKASGAPDYELDISNLNLINGGDGVSFQNYRRATVQNCTFNGNIDQNIDGIITSNVLITGNSMNGGAHGIQWYGVEGNYCENWTISNNIVRNGGGGGIWGARGRYIAITANVVEYWDDVCIDPERSFYVTVTGNTVKNGRNAALSIFNACDKITFSDNIVQQDSLYGAGFKIYGNNIAGLTDKSRNISLIGGSITMGKGNANPGVTTEQNVAENISIQAIEIYADGGSGIRSLDCNYTSILNVKARSRNQYVISIEGSSRCLIQGNEVLYAGATPATARGIYLIWRSSQYPIKNNTVRNNRTNVAIMDDGWGDNATGSVIENNETPSVLYAGTLNGSYTGKVRNNYDLNGNLQDGSNRYTITQMTNPTAGDLLYFDGTSWNRLPKGTDGQTLKIVSGQPAWSN